MLGKGWFGCLGVRAFSGRFGKALHWFVRKAIFLCFIESILIAVCCAFFFVFNVLLNVGGLLFLFLSPGSICWFAKRIHLGSSIDFQGPGASAQYPRVRASQLSENTPWSQGSWARLLCFPRYLRGSFFRDLESLDYRIVLVLAL